MKTLLCLALAFVSTGCAAASRGVDPSKPRAEAAYPVTLASNEERSKGSLDAWTRLLTEQDIKSNAAPQLDPVTATVKSLPPTLSAHLRLPRIGAEPGKSPTEEELRESLRRFLEDAAVPLGIRPAELSLVAFEELPGGVWRAEYRQSPFAHPVRGDYGRIEVTFTTDLRIQSLSSTAIPDVERLRSLINSITAERLTAERAVATLAGQTITYTDTAGAQRTRVVSAQGDASARELVVFARSSLEDTRTLQLHLAWEIAVGPAPSLLVYVDAIDGRQLGARPAAAND